MTRNRHEGEAARVSLHSAALDALLRGMGRGLPPAVAAAVVPGFASGSLGCAWGRAAPLAPLNAVRAAPPAARAATAQPSTAPARAWWTARPLPPALVQRPLAARPAAAGRPPVHRPAADRPAVDRPPPDRAAVAVTVTVRVELDAAHPGGWPRTAPPREIRPAAALAVEAVSAPADQGLRAVGAVHPEARQGAPAAPLELAPLQTGVPADASSPPPTAPAGAEPVATRADRPPPPTAPACGAPLDGRTGASAAPIAGGADPARALAAHSPWTASRAPAAPPSRHSPLSAAPAGPVPAAAAGAAAAALAAPPAPVAAAAAAPLPTPAAVPPAAARRGSAARPGLAARFGRLRFRRVAVTLAHRRHRGLVVRVRREFVALVEADRRQVFIPLRHVVAVTVER